MLLRHKGKGIMNNRRIGCCVLLLLLAAALVVGGCGSNVEDLVARPVAEKGDDAASNPPPSVPPLPPPAPPARGPVGEEPDAAKSENERPVEPPPVPPSVPPAAKPLAAKPQAAPSPGAPSIRLSAGVALPQTLPTGTAMGFSVDYEFTQGRPNPSSPYFLVIEPARGQPLPIKVPRMTSKGTLSGFVRGWRPEHGPFEGHIEDAGGNRLSRSIPLR